MNSQSWGAIFDWDGVIIDSSSYHEQSWDRLAEAEGRTLPPDHFKQGFGRKNQIIIPEILKWTNDPAEIERMSKRKEAFYREIAASDLSALSGVREFLEQLRTAGVPCVIGSSTPRENIDFALKIIGLAEFFDAMVTAEDVTIGKPNPEVFLKAAARIDRRPECCVVFEDAHFGIEAAHAAGMRVVAVATTHPPEELTAADLVVRRLDELTVGQLGAWFD